MADEFFEKVRAALSLIGQVDPSAHERVRNSLDRIVLVAGGGEVYLHPIRAYLVDAKALGKRTVLELAAAIIHEATHASMIMQGMGYEEPARHALEQECVAVEVNFLRKAGAPKETIEKKQRVLQSEWWTPAKLTERRDEQLRAHGVPGVLIKAMKLLRRR